MTRPRRAGLVRQTCCLALSVIALYACGCAGAPAGAGVDEVEHLVGDGENRTLSWRRGVASDDVNAAVGRLLAQELTADTSVQVAFLRNARLQALYEDLGIAQSDLVQAGLLTNPVFEAAALFGRGPVDLALSVTDDFLGILFLPLRRNIADAEFDAAKYRVATGVLGVEEETRRAFYGLQAETQLLEMREHVRLATSASWDAARALRAAGNVRELDVLSERALHDRAQVAVAASKSAVATARERLNVAMGLWGEETRWRIGARLPELPAAAPGLEDVERRAVAASLDLRRLEREVEAALGRADLSGALGGFADTEVGIGAERDDGKWSAGPIVRLSFPVFDRGEAAAAGAHARSRRSQAELAATAVEVRAAARAAAQRLFSARETVAFYRDEILPLHERTVAETQLHYNAMQIGVFQLLAARQRQIEAGQEYVEALREHWLARTTLDLIERGALPRDAWTPLAAPGFGEPE